MPDRGRIALVAALAIALAAGCSSTASPSTGSGAGPPASTTTIIQGTLTSQISTTVTSTAAGNTVIARPPQTTSEPAPVDATCPYLSDDAVADINGQHTGTTQIIAVKPYPICVFTRSDGGALASVRVIKAGTPQAAVAAVDAHVPIAESNPANQPPGWAGGSMVTDSGSIYAVSKGTIAIVAESNQQQSIKGRRMVAMTVANLGL